MKRLVLAFAAVAGVLVRRGRGAVQWETPEGRLALPAVLGPERDLVTRAEEAIRAA